MGTLEHWSKVQKYCKIRHHWPNSIADMTVYVRGVHSGLSQLLGRCCPWVSHKRSHLIYNTVQREIFSSAKLKYASRIFNFRGFYFHGTNVWCSDHTPTSWWPCPTCEPKRRPKQRSEEASLCNNSLVFLCVKAFAISKVSRLPPWKRNWLVEQKDSALLISTSTTLEHFV